MEQDPFETVSALQMLDRVKLELATEGAAPSLTLLRHRIVEMEELQDQARTAVEKLSEAVEKLRAPALRLGTLLQTLANGRALVCVNATDYVCNLDPALPEASLETGTRVLLNEAFAVTDAFGSDRNGPVVRITKDYCPMNVCASATKPGSRTRWSSAPPCFRRKNLKAAIR